MRKFPFVKQHDSMQCGVACLAMVCRHWGRAYSTAYLAGRCTPTSEGVSLKAIADAARGLGIDTVSARLTLGALAQAPLPCILHWNQNHFVVLHRVDRGGERFWIADPARGRVRCSAQELDSRWASARGDGSAEPKGVAMLLEPTPEFGRGGAPEVESRSMRFVLSRLREHRRALSQVALGLAIGCLLQLAMPFLTQGIVDLGIRHGDLGLVWLILLGGLAVVAGRTGADFLRRWLLLHLSARVSVGMVSDFLAKLLRLPMSFFDSRMTGDLLQRMADHQRVQSFLTQQALGAAFAALTLLALGGVLLGYDPLVFLVFALGTGASALWTARFLARRRALDYDSFERQAASQGLTFRLLTSMPEVKLQGCERRRRWEWEDAQADLFEVQTRALGLQQAQEAGSVFIAEAKNVLVTVIAAAAVIDGTLSLGQMLAVQYIVGQLGSPVAQLTALAYSLQDVKISLERINEVHRAPDEDLDPSAGPKRRGFPGPPSIRLRGVSFRYDRHSPRWALRGVDLEIPAGKVTAVVGASGSGKTTLVKLLLGYYPSEEGAIEVAGAPIGAYDLRWWRGRCGAVMQDGVIFSDSIARNIAAGDGEVDWERVRAAARTARIDDYAMSLPLRYDTRIGADAMGLSQGQRQRVLIARAVYRDPEVLFLDEATNSLDASNERAIVEGLDGFCRGRTVVVVAHRLSTVRGADRIVVLDGGRVAEVGTHAELVARRGAYYDLVKDQLELGE